MNCTCPRQHCDITVRSLWPHMNLTVTSQCEITVTSKRGHVMRLPWDHSVSLTVTWHCEIPVWRFILWNSVMSQCEVTVISRCETVLGSFLGSFQVASLACFLLSYTTNWYKTQSLIRIQMELLTTTWNQCKTDLKVTSSNLNVNNACKSTIETDLAFKKPIYLYLSIQNLIFYSYRT